MVAKTELLVFLMISASLLASVQANGLLIHEFHENFKLTGSIISRTKADSAQNCIHRCRRHAHCKLAGVKQIEPSSSKVDCVFATLQCYENAEEKMERFQNWHVYQLYKPAAKFYFAFDNGKKCLKYNPSYNHPLEFTQICSELFCANPDGIYHISSRKCIILQNHVPRYLSLNESCNEGSPLEQIPGPAVRQKSTGYCLHPESYTHDGGRAVAWPVGCTYTFYFKYLN